MSNEDENRGLSPDDDVSRTSLRSPLFYVFYVAAWLPVLYLLPADMLMSAGARNFAATISTLVTSINAWSANSPDHNRVAFFMALHWSFFPIYLFIAFRLWGARWRTHKLIGNPPKRSVALAGLLMIIAAFGVMFVPTEVTVSDPAIRPSRAWIRWMHESLLPNGIIAIVLPLWSAGILVAVWFGFMMSQFRSQK